MELNTRNHQEHAQAAAQKQQQEQAPSRAVGGAMRRELGEAVRQAEQTGHPVGVWGGLLQVVIVK